MYDNTALYKQLQELQVIERGALDKALQDATSENKPLGEILLDRNLIDAGNLGKLIAQLFKVPFVTLDNKQIPQEILTLIPEVIAREQRVIAYDKDELGLQIVTSNPANTEIIKFLSDKLGTPVRVAYTTDRVIENALGLYVQDIGDALEKIMKEEETAAKKDKDAAPPIIKIVETIITYGYKNNASDIHIEPEETTAIVRFRIDGILHDVLTLSKEMFPEILTRIKVMAKLRTDEHQAPQDGKIELTIDDRKLDIRVSTAPVKYGENVVMRLLSEHARQISLLTLGFSKLDLEKVERAYKKPYGAILATGPTGSGKTTTMYAILKLLNNRDVHIMTIEDPIEYDVEGVDQMQVNQKADLTFATGLRSILRQDPNIILVGEIRDVETADIAINAALTGHLVLSTLHTNDAATAIPRLIDMKIEPFLIASTVTAIIGQRLVRRIHTACRISEEIKRDILAATIPQNIVEKLLGTATEIRMYKGKGCAVCQGTGFEGRIGIFEVLEVTEAIKEAIIKKESSSVIQSIASKEGMTTMIEDGLSKALTGETTLEEILRVIKT